jgi:NAD(P)-dependent dehydrogenase (short-subunit alcohol dehydrogenase family)
MSTSPYLHRSQCIHSQFPSPEAPENNYTAQYRGTKGKWTTFITDDSTSALAKGQWSPSQDCPDHSRGYRAYGFSKFCAVAMMYELQARFDRDPVLSKISVLTVDPGAMATGIMRDKPLMQRFRHAVLKPLFVLVVWIAGWFMVNPMMRTTGRSARDVLRPVFDADLLGRYPKGVHLNGCEVRETSVESRDERKRGILWWDSLRYVGLEEGETLLVDWR